MYFSSPLSSSFLASTSYDTDTAVLTIEFGDGSTFAWEGQPESTYQALVSAVSPGSVYHSLGLHGSHSYRII
jgi:hypothetical protein